MSWSPTKATLAEAGTLSALSGPGAGWAQAEEPVLYQALEYQTEDLHFGQDVQQPVANEKFQIILSNELVDAFPVHLVEKRDHQLYEVYVEHQNGRLNEVLGEPSSPEVAGYLDSFSIPWQKYIEGWRAEINLDIANWLEQTSHRLQNGYLLIIDYGEKARQLYTPYRRNGTLTSYFKHQITERPLIRPGEQDLTAHVNFSSLIKEGRALGLRLSNYVTQRDWLEKMGIYEELTRLHDQYAVADKDRASDQGQVALLRWYNLRHRVATLTDASGMGNFKVLLMRQPG